MANSNYNNQQNMLNQNYNNQQNLANQNTQYGAGLANNNLQYGQNFYNNNMNNYANMQNNNAQYERNLYNNLGQANINANGTLLGAAQQEGQAEYDRSWGNWGNGLGMAGAMIKPFSDERLKKYKECSKKVVYRTPSKIKALKFERKGE
jgi:hypothetical protein